MPMKRPRPSPDKGRGGGGGGGGRPPKRGKRAVDARYFNPAEHGWNLGLDPTMDLGDGDPDLEGDVDFADLERELKAAGMKETDLLAEDEMPGNGPARGAPEDDDDEDEEAPAAGEEAAEAPKAKRKRKPKGGSRPLVRRAVVAIDDGEESADVWNFPSGPSHVVCAAHGRRRLASELVETRPGRFRCLPGAKCKGAAKTAVKPTLWECATCRKDNRDERRPQCTACKAIKPGAESLFDTRSLFLKALPRVTTESNVRATFARFGHIAEIRMGPRSGKRRHAVVTFAQHASALKALRCPHTINRALVDAFYALREDADVDETDAGLADQTIISSRPPKPGGFRGKLAARNAPLQPLKEEIDLTRPFVRKLTHHKRPQQSAGTRRRPPARKAGGGK
jgi:hypothetical protein